MRSALEIAKEISQGKIVVIIDGGPVYEKRTHDEKMLAEALINLDKEVEELAKERYKQSLALNEAQKIMETLGGIFDTDYKLIDIVNMCSAWISKYRSKE